MGVRSWAESDVGGSIARMGTFNSLLVVAALLAAPAGHALERTASNDALGENATLERRMQMGEAALLTAINKMLACNNKGKMFVSAASYPGKDSEGCVSIANSADALALETSGVDLSLEGCTTGALPYQRGKYFGCAKSYNLKALIPGASKAILSDFVISGVAGQASYPTADAGEARNDTPSFSAALGSLATNVSITRKKLNDNECSGKDKDSFVSVSFSPGSMVLTVTAETFEMGDKARCFSEWSARLAKIRLTGRKTIIKEASAE